MIKEELRAKAEEILKEIYSVNPDAYQRYLTKYWIHLFPAELGILRENTEKRGVAYPENPILIATLGATLEPIVLAIYLLNPQTIYLLYSSQAHLTTFQQGLNNAAATIRHNENYTQKLRPFRIGESPTSASLFKLLRGRIEYRTVSSNSDDMKNYACFLEDIDSAVHRNKIIFDMTGAKKSISGGCLLFAAFYDMPVYYMDFGDSPGDYDPNLGKPYPGACFYTQQPNPLTGFALKDLETAKTDFDNRLFYIVNLTLRRLLGYLETPQGMSYFDKEEIEMYNNFYGLSAFYNDWQTDKWFTKEDAIKINHLPHRMLWHPILSLSDRQKMYIEDPMAFYDEPEAVICYVTLQLALILRGAPLNKKEQFLKAYALEEFLISLILYRLYLAGHIEIETECDEKEIKKALTLNYDNSERLIAGGKTNVTIFGTKKVHFKNLSPTLVLDKRLTDGIKQFMYPLRRERNKAVHGTFGYECTEKNLNILKNLEQIWRSLLDNPAGIWFDDSTSRIIHSVKNIMEKDQWYFDRSVSPLRWDEAEKFFLSS